MPLEIVRRDITKMHVDAIVSEDNANLNTAGVACEVGESVITNGNNLDAKYIIHTVGPVWQGGDIREEEILALCYRNSLELACQHNMESIAFPLISTATFGYPINSAMEIAISTIDEFLRENDIMVYIVLPANEPYSLNEERLNSIDQYVNNNYIEEAAKMQRPVSEASKILAEVFEMDSREAIDCCCSEEVRSERSLTDVLGQLEESFSEMLLRLIDEKGMNDVDTYKRANIDRRLFSKIRTGRGYSPSKLTAMAFAIALRLNLDETRDLLYRAGYALSHCYKTDIIIEYFIKEGNYNIYEINEVLFAFDQPLLGGSLFGNE